MLRQFATEETLVPPNLSTTQGESLTTVIYHLIARPAWRAGARPQLAASA
jgi:hypothetical protein